MIGPRADPVDETLLFAHLREKSATHTAGQNALDDLLDGIIVIGHGGTGKA